MAGKVSIGNQSFEDMRETKAFYVDKTSHISTWWNSGIPVTLITRPCRFGKTLFLDTVNQFFWLFVDTCGSAEASRISASPAALG